MMQSLPTFLNFMTILLMSVKKLSLECDILTVLKIFLPPASLLFKPRIAMVLMSLVQMQLRVQQFLKFNQLVIIILQCLRTRMPVAFGK